MDFIEIFRRCLNSLTYGESREELHDKLAAEGCSEILFFFAYRAAQAELATQPVQS